MTNKKTAPEVSAPILAAAPDPQPQFPPDSVVERFANLFVGNPRSSGQFNPLTGKLYTKPQGAGARDFDAHFAGISGVGAVPILDNDTCSWAAIDVDNHEVDDEVNGPAEDIDIGAIDEAIRKHTLPLIPCRSKSGGVHCYLFLEKPQPAIKIRALMTRWAALVGYPGHEVFPKQAKLVMTPSGQKQMGNWINLPYFKSDDTNRYAVREGKRLTLAEFIGFAEDHLTSEADLRYLTVVEHGEAPPCVQKMLLNGVASGHRNEGLYATVVYFKKAFPADYETRAWEANNLLFKAPLPRAEVTRTITSAARPDYSYRCGEEPCRSLCDRPSCVKKKFGVTEIEAERLGTTEALPLFSDLVKYLTEPVRWELCMNGVKITNITTPVLLEWRAMREIVADRLTMMVPLIKPAEWDRILAPLMQSARIIETPDDVSINGAMRDRLREFAAKTDLFNKGEDKSDRTALLRGMPVVQVVDGERCVVFRQQDFVSFLKRTKTEELKGVNLWFAVKELGVGHSRIRVGEKSNINIWHIPVKVVLKDIGKQEPVEFKPEL